MRPNAQRSSKPHCNQNHKEELTKFLDPFLPRNQRARLFIGFALALLLSLQPVRAVTARDSAIEVTVTTSAASPYITLNWPAVSGSSLTMYRRVQGDASWGAGIALAANATMYADAEAQPGIVYEYSLHAAGVPNVYTSYGAIAAGYHVPLVEQRGNVVLLVDDTMSTPLAAELSQLQQNLVSDGWVVFRHDVPRQTVAPETLYTAAVGAARLAEVSNIRSIVSSDYNTAPAQNWSLLIVGHVPVPYSGTGGFDGHGDHYGAWPTDLYYADVNGTWTDASVSWTGSIDKRNYNVPGDGKFDQNFSSTTSKLATGRVDLANMTDVPTGMTETQLLQQYLVRDDRFRRNSSPYNNVARRGIIDPQFGQNFADVGWRNGFGMFGRTAGNMDQLSLFPTLETTPLLFAYGCGPGGFQNAADVANSIVDFGRKDAKGVFYTLFGSYFGDWDVANNLLRAPLAGTSDSLGLSSAWNGLLMYHMALGETIGYSARFSQNNSPSSASIGWQSAAYGNHAQEIVINLMGDPTLRLHNVTPPSHVTATTSTGGITLSWNASPDAEISGYHVYRATSASGPFVRITGAAADSTNAAGSPLASTATTYTDADPGLVLGSTYHYLVKAVRMETSASGSYANQSLGSAAAMRFAADGTNLPPASPDGLAVVATSTTSYRLTWTDNSDNEISFTVERRDSLTGLWADLATLPAGSTTFTDAAAPTGRLSHYRVRASNADGDSSPTDIATDYAIPGVVATAVTSMVVNSDAGTAQPLVNRKSGSRGGVGVTATTYSLFNPPLTNGEIEAWGTATGTPPLAAPSSWTVAGTNPRIAPPLFTGSTTSAYLSPGLTQLLPMLPANPQKFQLSLIVAATDPGSSSNRSFHIILSARNTSATTVPIITLRTVRGTSAGWLSLQAYSGTAGWQTIAPNLIQASVYVEASNTFSTLHPLALTLNVDWSAATYSLSYGAPGASPVTLTNLQWFQTVPNATNGTKLTQINFASHISQTGYAIDEVSLAPLDSISTFIPFNTQLTWNHGDASSRTVSIPLPSAPSPKLSEVLGVALKNPTNGLALGSPQVAYAIVQDLAAQTLPSPWQTVAFTPYGPDAGYAEFADGTFGIKYRGSDMAYAADSMRFIYTPVTGDFTLTARIFRNAAMTTSPRIGLAVRSALTSGSAMDAFLLATDTNLYRALRPTTDGNAVNYTPINSGAGFAIPLWLRMVRTGNSMQTLYSSDGVAWTTYDTTRTLGTANTTFYVGMVATSYTPPSLGNELGTYARFDNVTVHSLPAAPAGLAAAAGPSAGSITLAWTGDAGATSYRIERHAAGETAYTTLAESVSTTFTDTGLTPGVTYDYRVIAINPAYTSAASSVATFNPPTAYEAWSGQQGFLGTNAALPAADPDGDGLPNLIEYATNSNPTLGSSAAGPVVSLAGTGTDAHLQITFLRIADPSLTYAVQASDDLLGSWSDIWTSTGLENTSGPVTVSDPASLGTRRFLRLRVSY